MAIILQQPPSGLEILGNTLAGLMQKKREQEQQAKAVGAMEQIYDSLYNNSGQTAKAPYQPNFGTSDLGATPTMQNITGQAFNPSAGLLQAGSSALQAWQAPALSLGPQASFDMNATLGRNPFRAVKSAVAGGVPLATVLPMALQWDQEQKAEAKKTIDLERARNAILRMKSSPNLTALDQARLMLDAGIDPASAIKTAAAPTNQWEDRQHPSGLWYQRNKTTGEIKVVSKPKDQKSIGSASWGTYDANTGQPIYLAPKVGRGGGSGGSASPKLGKAEKWAETYELTQRIRDEETLQQYEEAGNMVDPKLQKAANEAAARMNQYWTISSGGEYGSSPGLSSTAEPQQDVQSSGMSSKMQDFAASLNATIDEMGSDYARSWIGANRAQLIANGIDADAALQWIP